MKKEERIEKLNKILELYTNDLTNNLEFLSQKFEISKPTISKFLKEHNVEIRKVQGEKSKLKVALEKLKTTPVEEVSKKYQISSEILNLALSEKNKSKLKQKIIDMAIQEYIDTPELDKNATAISAKYGINRKTLLKYLKERGINIANTGSAVHFNYNAFNKINTEESAYWLGFMYADGFIESKSNGVGLGVSIKDIEHMDKFCNFLQYPKGKYIVQSHQFGSKSTTNKNGEEMYMVNTLIKNNTLWNDLNSKGCVPNKSLVLTFPDESIFQTRELIRHFIRGYCDGDGCLTWSNKEHTIPSINFVGTKDFLEGIQRYIGKGYLMQKPHCSEFTYRLSYTNTKAFNAAKYMYENSNIYLNRKYNIYTKYCAAIKLGKNGEACDGNPVLTY